MFAARCPLWVRSGHSSVSDGCLLYSQKRTCLSTVVMSGLCQKRTYHLVGTGESWGRHRDAERLGRLEIDHEFVLGWRLHGEIGGLLAFEDAIDVSCGAPVLVDKSSRCAARKAGFPWSSQLALGSVVSPLWFDVGSSPITTAVATCRAAAWCPMLP